MLPLLLAAWALFMTAPARAADQSVWQLLPYNVRILIAFEPSPPITPRLEKELQSCLSSRIEGTVGAGWNAVIEPAPPALRGAMLRDVGSLKAEQIPLAAPAPDKVLLMAVSCTPGGLMVKARDFDVRTHVLSSPVERSVSQTGELGDAALDALLAAFAPLARIESARGNDAVLRLKASALPPRDPNLSFLRKGDVFQPIHRFNDREGNLRSASPVPWTFCIVEKVTPEETRCNLQTGVRTPITGAAPGSNRWPCA